MRDHIRFFADAAVHCRRADMVEILHEIKVLQDPYRELMGLGGGQGDGDAFCFQLPQQFRDSVIYRVFKDSVFPEIFPVIRYRTGCFFFGKTVILLKGFPEGRTDKGIEFASVGNPDAVFVQGVHDRIGDADAGIGEGAVQIKQAVLVFHAGVSSSFCGFWQRM